MYIVKDRQIYSEPSTEKEKSETKKSWQYKEK